MAHFFILQGGGVSATVFQNFVETGTSSIKDFTILCDKHFNSASKYHP